MMKTYTATVTRLSLLAAALLSSGIANAHDGHGLDAIPHDILHAAGIILLPLLALAIHRAYTRRK